MKSAILFVCVAALSVSVQATTFCTAGSGTWCEQPYGPDAGQYVNTAQYTVGTTPNEPLTTIIGAINGLGGGDMYAIYIPNPTAFSASFAAQTGTGPNGHTINGDSQAALYLFNGSGLGIEAADDGTAISAFNGTAGTYFVDITGDGNVPEYSVGLNKYAIFQPFLAGQISSPVPGAESLSAYSGNGCGANCAGGYDISLVGADYSGAPEPGSLLLTGSAVTMLGLLTRMRRKS